MTQKCVCVCRFRSTQAADFVIGADEWGSDSVSDVRAREAPMNDATETERILSIWLMN